MTTPTLDEQIAEIRRELALRERAIVLAHLGLAPGKAAWAAGDAQTTILLEYLNGDHRA